MAGQSNESTLKQALEAMLQAYRLKPGYHLTRIRQVWPEIFGRTIAEHTQDLRIYDRKLFVTITSASLRQELSMGRRQLCERLNKELGEDFLTEVVFR